MIQRQEEWKKEGGNSNELAERKEEEIAITIAMTDVREASFKYF